MFRFSLFIFADPRGIVALWPLFHYLLWQDVATEYASADSHYPYYESTNAAFARRIADVYRPGDLIWVHDYHLLLVPRYVYVFPHPNSFAACLFPFSTHLLTRNLVFYLPDSSANLSLKLSSDFSSILPSLPARCSDAYLVSIPSFAFQCVKHEARVIYCSGLIGHTSLANPLLPFQIEISAPHFRCCGTKGSYGPYAHDSCFNSTLAPLSMGDSLLYRVSDLVGRGGSLVPDSFVMRFHWVSSFPRSLTHQDLHTRRQKGNPRWHAWCESRVFPGLWVCLQPSIFETNFPDRRTRTAGTSFPLASGYVDTRRLHEELTSRATSLPSCTVLWVSMPRELRVTCSSFQIFSI